jgi:2-octaprenylphenol hydroxylase
MKTHYAAIVAGGGAVGACAAALLQSRARVAPGEVLLVERTLPAAPRADEPPDLRVSAVSRAGRRILESAGAWSALDTARLAPYERLRVWVEGQEPRGGGALCFDAAEIAEPDLGCIAENRALQAALLGAATQAGAELRAARITGLTPARGGATLHTESGDLTAELLVIADGADSPLRGALGIEVEGRPYGQRAIVARLTCERPHESTAWQCFLPTGPVALLPLASGEVSLVWSAHEARAAELLALDEADFCRALEAVMSPALGTLRLASERAAFTLRRQTATRWTEAGCVLVGDAAHTMHPLAGQGLNQGLLDVEALCTALGQRPPRESLGATRALRHYERERRAAYPLVAGVVDAFDRLFTTAAPARALGRAALATAAHSRLLRELFMREAGGSARSGVGSALRSAGSGRSSPRR